MRRLKASFTITVLETRTDQNSFFIGSPLENGGLSFLGYPIRSVPSRLTIGEIREPTDLNSCRSNAATARSCTIFTRADTNGGAPPSRRIKFVSLTSCTMCSSVIYEHLLQASNLSSYLSIYRKKGFARERNTHRRDSINSFIPRSQSRLFVVFTTENLYNASNRFVIRNSIEPSLIMKKFNVSFF